MRIIILGADGYLGWPTAMHFAARGDEVLAVDNYARRKIAQDTCSEALFETPNLVSRGKIFEQHTGQSIKTKILDCTNYYLLSEVFEEFQPEAVVHYAEQPSAPYSMSGFEQAQYTLNNNINVTFNVIHAVINKCPDCHIVKLGTMGEYGTPNIDIEEGWIEIDHKGRSDRFLFPRQAGSLYHTTKVLDTDLLWFYTRVNGLRVTDLMQGPVYGIDTVQSRIDPRLVTNFHYDDIFGTLLNRFMVQAVLGVPLTVYGQGGQTRGYLNITDTLQCVELAALSPPSSGELRILNQFTQLFSVNDVAQLIMEAGKKLGLKVEARSIDNPRKELENHYYNVVSQGFQELGLKPDLLDADKLAAMMKKVIEEKDNLDMEKIRPRVRWR